MVAKINIRVFKIEEQLRLKFGKKLRTASLTLIFIGSYKKKVYYMPLKTTASFFDIINSVYFCHFWHGSNEI